LTPATGPAKATGMHPVSDTVLPKRTALARLLRASRPAVMGILNVTPDSFSDGGRYLDPQRALEQAGRLKTEGADIIDVGAESTRPYGAAIAVSLDEELRRLGPVEHGVPVIIMHNRDAADPAIDILADITSFFRRSLDIAARAGITSDCIVLDPGIGFGKTPEQSLSALARLEELKPLGLPLLVGASRKRFIDTVSPAPPDRRLGGSLAAHLAAADAGAAIIRAHDVAETVQALKVAAAIRNAR
jgi:dihydropteroate synthase